MKRSTAIVVGLCLSVPFSAFADFQYTETTKVTGGSVMSMMKFAGALSKQARQGMEPVTSTVVVKGNRMAHINKDTTEIIDLDKETITHIDHAKKQYSVMTFQQMKEQMEKAQQQVAQQRHDKDEPTAEMTFKVNVKNTGTNRQVAGLNTTESIMQLSAEAKDKKTGQTGTFAMSNDMWMAPEMPGYAEVRSFYQRFALKMGTVLGAGMNQSIAAMQPGSAQGMAELYKEMSKLKGVPVLQVMRMGTTTNGQPLPAASEAPLPQQNDVAMPSAGEVAQESANNAASNAITSKLGKLGGLGGLGGFGRKKKEPEAQKPAESKADAPAQPTSLVFMETNSEMANFSSSSVDNAKFAIPAAYNLVQEKQ